LGGEDQRRLLRLPDRDLQLYPREGRSRPGAVRSVDGRATAAGAPVRRLLAQHGYVQGQAGAGRHAGARQRPLAGLETLTERSSACPPGAHAPPTTTTTTTSPMLKFLRALRTHRD